MPLVLTVNDVVLNPDHNWDDIEGVQYHYPNQYKNKIQEGTDFVYYRGVHRADGRRREQGEYFGRGRIGAVRIDPATQGNSRPSWFCEIVDYTPFNPPVPAKPNGVYYEQIPPNAWRNGVRSIDHETFARICAAAVIQMTPGLERPSSSALAEVPSLIVPRARVIAGSGSNRGGRNSRRAKEVGDWAEDISLQFVRDVLKGTEIYHRAARGETPGWDIDYLDSRGAIHRVEVKGTVGAAFTAIVLTAGELKAAQLHGESYWLYLVASCLTEHPRLQRICNPAMFMASGKWSLAPIAFDVGLAPVE